MTNFLRIFLPIFFIAYFGITFVLKSLLVAHRTGKNPLVLPDDDTVYGLIGKYFKITLMAIFCYVIFFALFPVYVPVFYCLNHQYFVFLGIFLMLLAFIWTIIAQNQMQNSWRIGIDENSKTELISSGLFSFSRNPIFLGMLICLIGLTLVTPNIFTLVFLILGYVFIQIQIRLEETFLLSQHGESYLRYLKKVKRIF